MNTYSKDFKKNVLAMLVAGSVSLVSASAMADSNHDTLGQDMKEGWLEGVVDGAFMFNSNVSALDIDVEVDDREVTLTGTVASEAQKSLAENIALNIDGVTEVDNKIEVDEKHQSKMERKSSELKSDISDSAITAKVKSKLLANDDIAGLKVDVDTSDAVVTLKGKVNSSTESDLAYYIARNTDGVHEVVNKLMVVENNS